MADIDDVKALIGTTIHAFNTRDFDIYFAGYS